VTLLDIWGWGLGHFTLQARAAARLWRLTHDSRLTILAHEQHRRRVGKMKAEDQPARGLHMMNIKDRGTTTNSLSVFRAFAHGPCELREVPTMPAPLPVRPIKQKV